MFSTATVSSRDSDFTGDDVEDSGTGRLLAGSAMGASSDESFFAPRDRIIGRPRRAGTVPKRYRWTFIH